MTVFTIGDGTRAEYPPGEYIATFQAFEHVPEGEHGPHYVFTFIGEQGETYKGFADERPSGPTLHNKLGRWLCGLVGDPQSGLRIDPEQYIGKQYLLVYAPNQKGNVTLQSLSPTGE